MKWTFLVSLAAVSVVWVTTASAQLVTIHPEETPPAVTPGEQPNRGIDRFVPARVHAYELGLGIGYNQPFGSVMAGSSFRDIANAGTQLEFDFGFRTTPQLLLGFYGTGAFYGVSGSQPQGVTSLWSTSSGFQGRWDFRPVSGLDPWVSLGTGWRAFWQNFERGTNAAHGWEIARVQVGLDVRINEVVAISPMVGADMSIFLTESFAGVGPGGFRNIPGRLSSFLFAGVSGRFDLGGQSVDRARYSAIR